MSHHPQLSDWDSRMFHTISISTTSYQISAAVPASLTKHIFSGWGELAYIICHGEPLYWTTISGIRFTVCCDGFVCQKVSQWWLLQHINKVLTRWVVGEDAATNMYFHELQEGLSEGLHAMPFGNECCHTCSILHILCHCQLDFDQFRHCFTAGCSCVLVMFD